MKVFTWIALFLYQVCGSRLETASDRQIYVKIIRSQDQVTLGADTGGCLFAEELHLLILDKNVTFDLHLHLNLDEDLHVPTYVTGVTETGKQYVRPYHPRKHKEDLAAYQDVINGSYVLAKCSKSGLEIEGVVYLNGDRSILEKASTDYARTKGETTLFDSTTYEVYNLKSVPEILPPHLKDFIRLNDVTPSMTTTGSSRKPRQAVEDYFVDVLVVVDFDIYKSFLTLSNNIPDSAIGTVRKYFAHVINGVNLRYKTITDVGFNINVRLIGYVIAQTELSSPWTEKTKTFRNGKVHVNADDVLEAVKLWVNTAGNVPLHDHVMLFTGYDLFGEDSGFSSNYTTGLAFIGTMCQGEGRSVSVVEDHGGFQSVGTAAHELGHSLGAEHDGLNNSCTPADRYIMAGASYNETFKNKFNPWRFSPCSINYIKTYVEGVANNVKESTCLRSKLTPIAVPDVGNEMPGQLLGPDEQCRHIYGGISYLCRGENFGDATDVCRAMFCRNPKTTNKCVLHVAARGTSCGNKRWCVQGQCVGHVNAPPRPRGCPFGDQTGAVSGGKTCVQIVKDASGYCYVKDFRTRCCSSCDAINTGVYGCEYGDRVLDCKPDFCGRKFKDGTLYDTDCCGTCNYSPPTTTPDPNADVTPEVRCRDQPEIDSITCHDYVTSAGTSTCYRTDVYNSCCRTCEEFKVVSEPSCLWGDRDPEGCANLTSNLIFDCPPDTWGRCCSSCKTISKRFQTPPATTRQPIVINRNSACRNAPLKLCFIIILILQPMITNSVFSTAL